MDGGRLEMTSLTDRGWNSAFDLVYSSMGPDMTNMDNLRKLTAASRRYVRLLVFKDGYNSVLQISQKPFVETPLCHLHPTEPVKFSHC